jgi:ABC-2 type transport system ATP-binding protein
VCDRVVIMNRGDIVARGTVEGIRDRHGTTEYRVYTTVPVEGAEPVERDDAAGDPAATEAHSAAEAAGERRFRTVVADMDAVESVRADAHAAGGEVADIRTDEPSLEEIFLDVAGEAPADAEREADP